MGYTHYWTLDISHEVNYTDEMREIVGCTLRLLDVAAAQGIFVAYEYDEPARTPEVGPYVVRFNGVGDDGCETFRFDAGPLREPNVARPVGDSADDRAAAYFWRHFDGEVRTGERGAFCKTRRGDYDAVVCAFLMKAKEVFGPRLSVGSDGSFLSDWAAGRALYHDSFGVEGTSPLKRDLSITGV